mgnify:CR=1 FL=1
MAIKKFLISLIQELLKLIKLLNDLYVEKTKFSNTGFDFNVKVNSVTLFSGVAVVELSVVNDLMSAGNCLKRFVI